MSLTGKYNTACLYHPYGVTHNIYQRIKLILYSQQCSHGILIPYQHALFAHRSGSFFGNHVGYIIEPNTNVHFSAGSQLCIAPPCVRHCEALWTRLLLI